MQGYLWSSFFFKTALFLTYYIKKKLCLVNTAVSVKRTQSRQQCCQPPARKGKVKCLTLPFEVQSSIEEGQPRKELQNRRQWREKKNEPHNVLLMSSSLLWETQIWAVMPQRGIFVCSSSLIWLIYSWDRDIVYPHTTQLNLPSFPHVQWDLGTRGEGHQSPPIHLSKHLLTLATFQD